MLSAEAILAIPLSEPERLFSAPDSISAEYHGLVMHWHADRNKHPSATKVSAHINVLRDEALHKAASGTWRKPYILELPVGGGKIKRVRYRKRHEFELGEMVYGNEVIAYVVKNEYADLVEAAHKTINRLPYANQAMRDEIERYMPKIVARFETTDGRCVTVMKKTEDVYLMRDVLAAFNGAVDLRHMAWMMNATYNLACYLNFAGLTHNDISPDTLFVSPKFHSVMLYGGWWYSTPVGAKMNALPARTVNNAPPDVVRDKHASHRTDTTMIRLMGRELLGDPTGIMLAANAAVPKPITQYLRLPASETAVEDYRTWKEKVLLNSLGKPRFVKLEIPESEIFKGG